MGSLVSAVIDNLVWKMLNKARALAVIYPVHQWRYGTHKSHFGKPQRQSQSCPKTFSDSGLYFLKT